MLAQVLKKGKTDSAWTGLEMCRHAVGERAFLHSPFIACASWLIGGARRWSFLLTNLVVLDPSLSGIWISHETRSRLLLEELRSFLPFCGNGNIGPRSGAGERPTLIHNVSSPLGCVNGSARPSGFAFMEERKPLFKPRLAG